MWTATAEDILAKVQRARAPLDNGSLKLRRTTSWLSHFRLQQFAGVGSGVLITIRCVAVALAP